MKNVQGFSTAMLSMEYDIDKQCSGVYHCNVQYGAGYY